MTMEITRKSVFVSEAGGTLDMVSRDGEVVAQIAVPAGVVQAIPYLALCPEDCVLQVSAGLVALMPNHRIGIQAYGPGSHDTGANPDYRPTSASRLEREMRLQLARLQAGERRLEARMRSLEAVERVPDAPPQVQEGPDVVEQPDPPKVDDAAAADGQ